MREFADRAVPRDIIDNARRAGAEVEERALSQHRASEEWLQTLKPLGTDEHKPFLETAPWLIAPPCRTLARRL